MKKGFLLLSLMLLCTACDPPQYAGDFYVKNLTDQTLQVSLGDPATDAYISILPGIIVAPGDSVSRGGISIPVRKKKKPSFDQWIKGEVISHSEEISLRVFSKDQTLLKEWRLLAKDQPGKQFFDESFWRHYSVFREGAIVTITDVWIFDILPEDLIQSEP